MVPLPNENLIEEDVPFARTNVGAGPVVDSIGAPYYPGDIAADLGSLLLDVRRARPPAQRPAAGREQVPDVAGLHGARLFGVAPSQATPAEPSIFEHVDRVGHGRRRHRHGERPLAGQPGAGDLGHRGRRRAGRRWQWHGGGGAAQSLLDMGNISVDQQVSLGASSITSTATAEVKTLDIAGLIDIAGLDRDGHGHLGRHDRHADGRRCTSGR